MKKYILTILFLFLFLAFGGCAPKKVTAPFKGYVLPPEDVLKNVSRTDNLRDTLKAIAHIAVDTPEGKYSMKVALIVKRPSFLRVEAMPIIGPSDLFLSISENSLKVFLPKEGKFYIGHATRKNLAMFFPINLKAEDIISILVGTPPYIKEQNITLRGQVEGELYRINVMTQGKKIQSLWVNPDGNLVKIEVLDNEGEISYTARLKDHHQICGTSIPGKVIIITGKPSKLNARIRYSDTQLTQNVNPAIFDLDIPPGIEPIFID